jgi:hypothetical protein
MKIYTEVNYVWSAEKGDLIQTSSKSYDYEGEVALCHHLPKWIHPLLENRFFAIAHYRDNGDDSFWRFGRTFKEFKGTCPEGMKRD